MTAAALVAILSGLYIPVREAGRIESTITELTVAVSELKTVVGNSNGSIAQIQTHLAQLDAREDARDANRQLTQQRLQALEDRFVQLIGQHK